MTESLLKARLHASNLRPVILESPYAGEIELNTAYARACMLDCFAHGEAPFASHMIYPQVLDEADEQGRAMGIGAGYAWGLLLGFTDPADCPVKFYTDLGWSNGMHGAAEFYRTEKIKTDMRRLPNFDKWLEGYRRSHVMPEIADRKKIDSD